MKRNDIFIIISSACYSILFFQQLAGINFLIFSTVLTLFLFLRTENKWRNKGFLAGALGAIVSGISVWLYGSNIALICNILSLVIMSSFALHAENSLVINLFHAAYSYISVSVYMIIDMINKTSKTNENSETNLKPNIFQKIILLAIPLLISSIFFLLYRSSNDVFNELTNKINLDFISVTFILFSLSGFFLMYAFYLQRNIRPLHDYDRQKSNDLNAIYIEENPDWISKSITSHFEKLSGIILFIMLNLLLASVNMTDIIYIWTKHKLPVNVSYSEFVHNGIAALITSILFAICIILFYFRGSINFNPKNKTIKYLAYVWIAQNTFMILSTMMRNKMYVEQYSLTEKRIGVFVYLLLALIGLLLTVYKIANQKNNLFLFRANSWACYLTIITFCAFNWSPIITSYNISQSKSVKHFALDIDYLGNLSLNNLQLLINYYNENHQENQALKNQIDAKIVKLLIAENQYDWRSNVHARSQLIKYIYRLNDEGKWSSLNASNKGLSDLTVLKPLNQLESLDLSQNSIWKFIELENFTQLKELNLSKNQIYNIDTFSKLPLLEELDLSDNNIDNIDLGRKTPLLKMLNMDRNNLVQIDGIEELQALTNLNLSNNSIQDLSQLSQLTHLKKLTFQNNQVQHIPYIPELLTLDISQCNGTESFYENWIDSKNLNNLQELIAGNTLLIKSDILSNDQLQQHLKSLDISNNGIKAIDEIQYFKQLQTLNISGNNLLIVDDLAPLSSLETLIAQQTTFQSLNFISSFTNLKSLDLSNAASILGIDSLFNESVQSLLLNNCNIKFISKKVSFKNLKNLSIEGCTVSDISFIRNSKKLESLSLSRIDEKNMDDILYLPNLKNIKTLYISDAVYQKIITAKPDIIINRYEVENRYSRID